MVSKSVEFSVNGSHYGRHIEIRHVNHNFSLNLMIPLVLSCQKTYV